MMQRLGPCPQNCPDRYANERETCHSTCQRYMRYKLTKLTECIVMRKSREYDAADNIAGLERCVKAMVVLGFVGIAAAVAFVAM